MILDRGVEGLTIAGASVSQGPTPRIVEPRLDRTEEAPPAPIRLAFRTLREIAIDDPEYADLRSQDPYLARVQPRSALCVPLVYGGRAHGVLYLENEVAAGVYNAGRREAIRLLATQIAISLEHTQLYSNLELARAAAEAARDALEARVAERTADLKVKNSRLTTAMAGLKNAQAQLVRSEKMASLGLLVSGIAHELKNPLNFVNNFAELALDFLDEYRTGDASGEDVFAIVEENLRRISRHGQRANRIINAMLLHARVGDGEPIDVEFNLFVGEHAHLAYQGFSSTIEGFDLAVVERYDPSIEILRLRVRPRAIPRLRSCRHRSWRAYRCRISSGAWICLHGHIADNPA